MSKKGVTHDPWRIDIPEHESYKSLESTQKNEIFDFGCLITPLNAQIDAENDLKSDTISQVCCNTFLRTRALSTEWTRIKEYVINIATEEFGNIFKEIKKHNFYENFSALPIFISSGSSLEDFDITFNVIDGDEDIISIKLEYSNDIDYLLENLTKQVSKKVKLKKRRSLIKGLETSKESLENKIILTVISENHPDLLYSLQLIREYTKIPIGCLILNVINIDLFESQLSYELYNRVTVHPIQDIQYGSVVDKLFLTLLFEPGFTTFLHHPNKVLEIWESYYNESFSLSSIMLKLHEMIYKAMYDRPLGFSARSLIDLLGHETFHKEVIPAIISDYSFNKICDSEWARCALSRLASMVLAGGINEPLISYYQISLNNTSNGFLDVCNYQLPSDKLDENIVHLALGPLSKGALELSILKLRYTIGLKIAFELMKWSEINSIKRVSALTSILYFNDKYPTEESCEKLFEFVQGLDLPDNYIIKDYNKPFDIIWFKELFQQLPFYHPLSKQIAISTKVSNIINNNEKPDWKLLADTIISYKKCNAWVLFKNFKEQLSLSSNVGIAAIRFISALASICHIMGICSIRQRKYFANTQNSLAKSLAQLIIYRLPNI